MVTIVDCPPDEVLGYPLFEPGACFGNREFSASLWEQAWPVEMTVAFPGPRRYWDPDDIWTVYTRGEHQAIRSTLTGVCRGPRTGYRGKLVLLE